MQLQSYLNRERACSCGKVHFTGLKYLDLSEKALESLGDILKKEGWKKVFVLSDQATEAAAGRTVKGFLIENNIAFGEAVLPEGPAADELGVGAALIRMDPSYDLLLAVGSGTINDIGKFVSHRMGIPYIVFATAPSVDGFASNVAAMTVSRMKTTFTAHVPAAVLADPGVLAASPAQMIAAGAGDILGKYTALSDWRLSHLINGEYFCPEIARMMEEAVGEALSSVKTLQENPRESVVHLMEALTLSGIAMSFAGNSRPASGSEHHISHFWEMRFITEGRAPALHGAKVGVGTVLSLTLAKRLAAFSPDWDKAFRQAGSHDHSEWEKAVQKGFGPAAGAVLALEKTALKNDPDRCRERLLTIRERWPEIQSLFAALPEPREVAALLRSLGGPAVPSDVGVSPELTREAILLAKEVRDRYTILQLLWDLGLLEEWAGEAALEIEKEGWKE